MANEVKFKINGLTSALTNEYVRVTDTSRALVYEGDTLTTDEIGNSVVNVGESGTVGQDVLIYGDNYNSAGLVDFKGFRGAGVLSKLFEWNALSGITEVQVWGASISGGIFEGYEDIISKRLAYEGLTDVTITSKSVGGRGVSETITAWEAYKSTITGRSDILILTHCLGNSVSSFRPWVEDADDTQLVSDYAALLSSMAANGQVVMPVGTTFRNYGGDTVFNEENGSLPYNINVLYPTLPTLPVEMSDGEGRCYLDAYEMVRNNYVSMQSAGGDGIHFHENGYALLRYFWVESLISRIKGLNPTIVAREETPNLDDVIPREFITCVGKAKAYAINTLNFTTDSMMFPSNTYLPNSITVTQNEHDTNAGNSATFDTGDNSISLYNDEVKDACIQTSSTSWIQLQVIKGLNPNQNVTLTICAFRSIGTTSSRSGDYSVDGGSTFVTIDASTQSSDHYHTFTTQADENGELVLSGRVTSGSRYCHFNGSHVTPL